MNITKTKAAIVAGVVVVAGGIGAAVAIGSGDDDGTEVPITGSALEKAEAAALEATGGGSVTETEAGDEEGAYEVEVTLPDGSQTDVHLDKEFNVLSEVADDESEDEGAE